MKIIVLLIRNATVDLLCLGKYCYLTDFCHEVVK